MASVAPMFKKTLEKQEFLRVKRYARVEVLFRLSEGSSQRVMDLILFKSNIASAILDVNGKPRLSRVSLAQ